MMTKSVEQVNAENETKCFFRPLAERKSPDHINQKDGSFGQPLNGLEEYKNCKLHLFWEIRGLGRLYVLSH